MVETIPKTYAKDYMFLQVPYDTPVAKSRMLYRREQPGFGLKYAHRLDSEWIVGLGMERKPVILKRNDHPMSLLSLSSQTQAVFRIYHPFYFLVGTEIAYLLPTIKSTPPFQKDPVFSSEVSVGLNASLWWLTSRKSAVTFQVERWKGTKTTMLQGYTMTLGYGIGFL